MTRKHGISILICFFRTVLLLTLFGSTFAQKDVDEISALNKCWDVPLQISPIGRIQSDDNRIYIPGESGVISAFDAETGKSAWTAELGGRINSNVVVRVSDIVVSTSTVGEKESSVLRSLSKGTGIVNWTARIDQSDLLFLLETKGGIFAITTEGSVALLDKNDGSALWKRPTMGSITALPEIGDDFAVVAAQTGEIYVISIADGSVVSKFTTKFAVQAVAVTSGKRVASGDIRGNLVSQIIGSGKRSWKFKGGAKWSFVKGASNGIIGISADNFVYMLSADRGKVVWKRRLQGRVLGDPAISPNYLIPAVYGENTAYVVDLKNGRFVNRIDLPEKSTFLQSPVFAAGSVYAVTSTGLSRWSLKSCVEAKRATQ